MPKQGGWESTAFAANLRRLREAAGLTQAQLAEKAGIHKQTIVKLEAGAQEPAWPLVLVLAAALGVDCTAFTQEVAGDSEPRKTGRPRKQGDATTAVDDQDEAEPSPEVEQTRKPGRPRKTLADDQAEAAEEKPTEGKKPGKKREGK